MNFTVPKTFKIRQQILDFLSEKRKSTDLKKNDVNEFAFTITEISEKLKINRNLIDDQMDVLYKLKQVTTIPDDIKENRFFINDAGFYAASSKESLNEGKLLNSQIISNYTNSFFQIITGIIALYTIYKSYSTIDTQNVKIEEVKKSIFKLEEQVKDWQLSGLNLNEDTLRLKHPRNSIKDSLKK